MPADSQLSSGCVNKEGVCTSLCPVTNPLQDPESSASDRGPQEGPQRETWAGPCVIPCFPAAWETCHQRGGDGGTLGAWVWVPGPFLSVETGPLSPAMDGET